MTFSTAYDPNPKSDAPSTDWQAGVQFRDWYWQGWQIRYAFVPCADPSSTQPPFLLVHGFGAAIGHWRQNLAVLSQQAPVYAIDLLGFGHSQKAATSYTVPLWSQQLYAFWQQFIQIPVVLVGNSLSSLVSLNVAGAYPDMLAGLILLNLPDASVLTAQGPKWAKVAIANLQKSLAPLGQLFAQVITSPLIFTPLFNWIRHPHRIRFWAKQAYCNPKRVDDQLVAILSQPAYDLGAARALVAMTRTPNAAIPATQILPSLDIPILLVWGKNDRLVPATLAPLFKSYSAQLELVELDRVGHCPHDECPQMINRMIQSWIDVSLQGSFAVRAE